MRKCKPRSSLVLLQFSVESIRRGVATEDVLNLETNFLAFEITVANAGSLLLLVCPTRGNLVLLILNFRRVKVFMLINFLTVSLHI